MQQFFPNPADFTIELEKNLSGRVQHHTFYWSIYDVQRNVRNKKDTPLAEYVDKMKFTDEQVRKLLQLMEQIDVAQKPDAAKLAYNRKYQTEFFKIQAPQ
jgi:hypothetical protein